VPIYDYVCSNCGRLTEVVHGIHDGGPKFCPECGAEGTMTKAFAPPAIVFKGSGWAKKDRSTPPKTASPKKDDAAAKPGSSPSDTGTGSATSASSSSSGTSPSSGSASSGAASGD
jgi:putative FmdB family regulatory protein